MQGCGSGMPSSMNPTGMLFHVVNDRHRKKRAMIFTTNKTLSARGRVLHDKDLAHTILDRILERGHVLALDGPRCERSISDLTTPSPSGAPDQPARIFRNRPARISGTHKDQDGRTRSRVGTGKGKLRFGQRFT